MPHTIINPDGLHNPIPFGYSHSASVPAGAQLVFISGQYGSTTDSSLVSSNFAEQVQRSFHNLGIALAAHGLSLRDVVQLRSYVLSPDFEKLHVIGQAVRAGCGDVPPTHTVLGVSSLAMPEMLFEVEAVAART
jgi:enamine deaminase RidA (YjgF/YER057c/UK114 family)